MRLWKKLTLIFISITFAVMSGAVLMIVSVQASSLRRTDEENVRSSLNVYCTNIVSTVQYQGETYRDLTFRSIVSYYFSAYAALSRDGNSYYSLAQNGEYLSNLSPYDPMAVMQAQQSSEPPPIWRGTINGDQVLIGHQSFSGSNQTFDAYLSVNVSATQSKIAKMWGMGFGTLLLSTLLAAALTAIALKKATQPIENLTRTAKAISQGEYQLRTSYASKDEIGQLSIAFDTMAASVEDKITFLDTELQKRQLLIGALSHEIKTPMTSIVGYADTLLQMPLSDQQKCECAQKIAIAGRRAETLSQKMMELIGLSDEHSIDKKCIQVEEFVHSLKEALPYNVSFSYELSEIHGDETLLYSLVHNLVHNALRASPNESSVDVLFTSREDMAVIKVTDHGAGIEKEHLPLLTEPFFRVDKARARNAGGAGLGLSICKLICERHGGTIQIESTVGRGTTVRATISLHTT